jgi:hypothetical protein
MDTGRSRRGGRRPERDGFRDHEHAHAVAGDPVDIAAWRKALDHRDSVPLADLSTLDPGPRIASILDGREEGVLFVGLAAKGVTARLVEAEPTLDGAPIVRTIAVDSDVDFTVGTVVIKMPDLREAEFIPETTRVFDLKDGKTEDPRLIKFSAVGPASKYVWARICGRGLYSAIALPIDLASLTVLISLKALAHPMSGESQRARLTVARSIAGAVARTSTDRRRRGAIARGDLARAVQLQGLPVPFFDAGVESASREALDQLAGRFATNPFLPEVQILLDMDRERSQPWSG